jgi:predicted AAA+ superfamily ATPase
LPLGRLPILIRVRIGPSRARMAGITNPLERHSLFGQLPLELSENLRRDNPWWSGSVPPRLPPFRRWPFEKLRRSLERGLAPATVLRGPRRVGKTILLRQVMDSLLTEGVAAKRLLYVSFDELPTIAELREPILAISRWYENTVLEKSFNTTDREGKPAYLFFDEVQNLPSWAPQVKHLVDNHRVRVLLTGSSSLRIEAGRDSLAGRIETLDLGPLYLREIAAMRLDCHSRPIWPENGLEALLTIEFWKEALKASNIMKPAFGNRSGYSRA